MALILRKCWASGYSNFNFFYGNAGDIVTAPDWDPKPECGNGLHGLLEGNGNWDLLVGSDWLVIEANESDIVNIDNQKCKFRTGKILFRGTANQLINSEFPNKFNLNEHSAFNWAYFIGNKDIMIGKIASSYWAYKWAYNIGDKDVMINKITESKWAYWWAYFFGNYNVMKPKVTDQIDILLWNYSFPYDKITT